MTARRGQQGFALVEVLVALALLALVGLLASGAFGFGARVWERTGERADELRTWWRARAAMEALLTAARPRRDPAADGAVAVLQGDAERIAFDVPGGAYGPDAFPQRVEWSVSDGGVDMSLPSGALRLPAPGRLRFAYRGADAAWRDRWDAAEGAPPLLVRVVSSDPEWPPLVVRLWVRTDPLCEFDLARAECRR